MSWLVPGFLAGGVLIGLPILLHFLRSRPKTMVRFPSLRFLGESALRDMRKHRLRRWITLALRTLVIALLAAAFARPFWKDQQAAQKTALIIAVDNSMSMQAGTRWDELRRQALEDIDLLTPGDQAGILLINPTPHWAVPFTREIQGVRAALLEMKPGYETTRYAGALRMAGDTLATLPAHAKIIAWMADEQRLGWLGTPFDQPLQGGVKIHFGQTISEPRRQAAITAVHWIEEPNGSSVEVSIRLYKPAVDQRHLTLREGDHILAEQAVSLRQDGETKVKLSYKLPADKPVDGLCVSLDPDDLPADDTAWIAAVPGAAASVLCEEPKAGVDFLTHALGATHKLSESPFEATPLPEGEWPAKSVAIVRGEKSFASPQLEHLNHFAEAGGALWVFVDGSAGQTNWLEARGVHVTERVAEDSPWHLRDWDSDSPVLSAFGNEGLLSLMDVEFYQGFNLTGDRLTSLANWPDGSSAIAEVNVGGKRLFLCGFAPDRDATNWIVQPSFVPFVHQAVRWLASLNTTGKDWRVGDTIPLPSSQGMWKPIDSARPAAARQVTGSVRPDVPGLYEFSDGKTRTVYAVNTPLAESDLAPWPDAEKLTALQSPEAASKSELKTTGPALSDEVAESQQHWWWWLLAFCAVGMMAELALANRTAA